MGAQDYHIARSKRKAITALLPYTIWQERGGRSQMFDAFLYAARASMKQKFLWKRAEQFASPLLSKASPRAILLASPHIPWRLLKHRGDLVQLWAMATRDVPYTEEIGESVVNTLLQIASEAPLLPHIPLQVWSWLTKLPSIPPVCLGRCNGTRPHIIRAVRRFRDIGILKSYFILVWAEWDFISSGGFDEMCDSIREDFSGPLMHSHREDLIQRLDHILGQLDLGLGHLGQHNPNLREDHLQEMGDQYSVLKRILSEMDTGFIGTSHLMLCSSVCQLRRVCIGLHATIMCALPLMCP